MSSPIGLWLARKWVMAGMHHKRRRKRLEKSALA